MQHEHIRSCHDSVPWSPRLQGMLPLLHCVGTALLLGTFHLQSTLPTALVKEATLVELTVFDHIKQNIKT